MSQKHGQPLSRLIETDFEAIERAEFGALEYVLDPVLHMFLGHHRRHVL
jgi:hypothetical protein